MKQNKMFLVGGGIFLFVAVALFLGSDTGVLEPTPQDSSTTMGVPAPGFEDVVDETVVASSDDDGDAPGYEDVARLAGAHSGSWTNTTFGSQGNITIDLTVNPDGTAQMTLDVDGIVFGLLDPDPLVIGGTYDARAITFTGESDLFGPFTMRVGTDNSISMDAPSVAAVGIDRLEVRGTIDEASGLLEATYTVYFTGGGEAQGIIGVE